MKLSGYIDINIGKPVYETDKGSFVYIRDKFIKQAQKENKYLRITVPKGTGIVTPNKWMKNAKKLEQIFKIPTSPMVLYGNVIEVSQGSKYEVGDDGIARLI